MDLNAEDAIFGTPLVAAARGGHTEVVAALLRKDEVWPDQHSQRDTPLTAAVNGGHLECARLLLDYRNKDIAQKLVATPQQSHDDNCALMLQCWTEAPGARRSPRPRPAR